MNPMLTALARMLIFPGLLFAVPAAWFFLWVERKAVARMQERVGPPFMQPFWDFVKLLGKSTPPRPGIAGFIMRAWPLIAVASAAGAVGLLPVLPLSGGFEGDLILLLALLELPSICIIAAGFSSRSIFGEIGSAREAALSVSYNIVFLLAIVSIAASQHTFRLEALAAMPSSPLHWLGVLAILVCLPAKLHINPFSLPNAEQEIYAGPMTEYAGPELAMWELAHGLEWVAATGLVATLVAPHIALAWGTSLLAGCLFVVLSIRRRAAALRAGRGHGAPRHRFQRALLLAVHAHLRGACHLVRDLREVPVMNILTMLWKNLRRGYQTLLFPARPKVTARFRGLVQFDPALLHRLRHLQNALHLPRHRHQAGQRRVHLELQPRPVHLLRPLRGRLHRTRAQGRPHRARALAAAGHAADLRDTRRIEKVLHRGAPSARTQTRRRSSRFTCSAGASRCTAASTPPAGDSQ